MLIHEFDELMDAKPFQSFEVCTSDGRAVTVKGPEFAWRTPNLRTIIVYTPDERMHMIDLQLVTKFVYGGKSNGRGATRRRKK